MSGLPYNCAMLARAEMFQDPDKLLPDPIWNVIVAIGKLRWVFITSRDSDTPPDIAKVVPLVIDGLIKCTSFFHVL